MATKKSKPRGSTKLSATRKAAGGPSALLRSVRALDRSSLKNGIIIDGTPFPEIIRGSLTVKVSGLGSSLSKLLKLPGVQFKPVELFPLGIPSRIDSIKIVVNGKVR